MVPCPAIYFPFPSELNGKKIFLFISDPNCLLLPVRVQSKITSFQTSFEKSNFVSFIFFMQGYYWKQQSAHRCRKKKWTWRGNDCSVGAPSNRTLFGNMSSFKSQRLRPWFFFFFFWKKNFKKKTAPNPYRPYITTALQRVPISKLAYFCLFRVVAANLAPQLSTLYLAIIWREKEQKIYLKRPDFLFHTHKACAHSHYYLPNILAFFV